MTAINLIVTMSLIAIIIIVIIFVVLIIKSKKREYDFKSTYKNREMREDDYEKQERENQDYITELIYEEAELNSKLSKIKKRNKILLNGDSTESNAKFKSDLEKILENLYILKAEHEEVLKNLKIATKNCNDRDIDRIIFTADKLTKYIQEIIDENKRILKK